MLHSVLAQSHWPNHRLCFVLLFSYRVPWYCQGQGCRPSEEEVNGLTFGEWSAICWATPMQELGVDIFRISYSTVQHPSLPTYATQMSIPVLLSTQCGVSPYDSSSSTPSASLFTAVIRIIPARCSLYNAVTSLFYTVSPLMGFARRHSMLPSHSECPRRHLTVSPDLFPLGGPSYWFVRIAVLHQFSNTTRTVRVGHSLVAIWC